PAVPDPLATLHEGIDAALERAGLRHRRSALLASATGQVVELGAATGANLSLYDGDRVALVVALETHPGLRRRLLAREAGLDVTECESFTLRPANPVLRTAVVGSARPRPAGAGPGEDGAGPEGG